MKTAYKALLPALILLPAAATAQEQLTKEIDVEREIVPELRAASRMEVFPATVRPTMKTVRLTPGELTSPADYQPLTFRYEPASAGAAAPLTPYCGYVDAGYFPVGDFGVAAGFAAVSRENTTLNVWANLNRRQYDDKNPILVEYPEARNDYKTLDVAAGVDFVHRFSPKGRLGISTDFGYSNFNKGLLHSIREEDHAYLTVYDPTQNVIQWYLIAGWDGSADNGLRYTIGARTGIFNYSKAQPQGIPIDDRWFILGYEDAQKQTTFGANVGAMLPINSVSEFGMDLATDWQRLKVVWIPGEISPVGLNLSEPKTFGVSNFTPYYSFHNAGFVIHAGVRLDLASGNGSKLYIAPDVKFAYNPVAQFGVWLNATGGSRLNTLESLYAVSRYMLPSETMSTSRVKLDSELGFRVGPFKGIALQTGATYGNAHDWIIPWARQMCEAHNLHAFKVFVGLTAAWRDYVSLTARYDRRLGDGQDNFWYAWRDDTRSAVSASLTIRPFSPLEITAGYTGRFERYHGDISTLSAGAIYRITAPLSVFARFDNILNRTQYDVVGFQTPGFNGLFGVEYKF